MKLMQFSMVVMFSLCLSPSVAEASGDLSVSGTTTTTDLNVNSGSIQQIPGNLVSVGSLDLYGDGGAIHVAVSGRYAYVIGTDLHIVDVTDPSAPRLVGSMDPCASPCFPSPLFVSGRYAYTLDDYSGELIVIDVSDPSDPTRVGSVAVGSGPESVFVSGRYAYVVNTISDDLRVVDISDPVEPTVVGSLGIGGLPRSIYVSGRYAYVIDSGSDGLKVIDVFNPESPSLVSSFGTGSISGWSVYVSGSYAYVADASADALRAIDISDPAAPSMADSLTVGGSPSSAFVSGRYVYVVDGLSDDLKVVDATDPTNLGMAGSLSLDTTPGGSSFAPSVYVAGRYAYVADAHSAELEVIDITGAEVSSLVAHSLEAGNLQVRNDVIAQGQLQVTGGVSIGTGGLFSDGNIGVSGTIAIANDVAPTSFPANLVQLYARDEKSSSELVVLNEAGTHTVLSPHNFSLVGQPSEPMAWSFYSENQTGKINVDMLRTVRLVEAISGRKLVHTELKGITGEDAAVAMTTLPSIESMQAKLEAYQKLVTPLVQAVQELKGENKRLANRVEALEKKQD